MNLIVCPPCDPGSIFSHGGEPQGFFSWLITRIWRVDGRHQVVTNRLEGYEEYEAIQLLLPSGPSPPPRRSKWSWVFKQTKQQSYVKRATSCETFYSLKSATLT